MDKRLVLAAKKLALGHEGYEKLSSSVKRIIDEVSCGQIVGKKVFLSVLDRIEIDKYYSNILGISLLKVDFKVEDRIEAASIFKNEKWAQKGVFSDLLNFSSLKNPLPLKTGEIDIASGAIVSSSLEDIDIKKISKVIVTENGEVLNHINLLKHIVPDLFKDALVLYRGHGINENYVFNFLENLNNNCYVGFFCDYDASGLAISLNLKKHAKALTYLIIPKNIDLSLAVYSKEWCYQDQKAILEKLLDNKESFLIKQCASDLYRYKLALTQEHMLVKVIFLQAIVFN
mgnify:CR=1 FL=1